MEGLPKLNNNQIRELHSIIASSDSKSPKVRRAQAILLVDQGVDAVGIKAMTNYGRTRAFVPRQKYLA